MVGVGFRFCGLTPEPVFFHQGAGAVPLMWPFCRSQMVWLERTCRRAPPGACTEDKTGVLQMYVEPFSVPFTMLEPKPCGQIRPASPLHQRPQSTRRQTVVRFLYGNTPPASGWRRAGGGEPGNREASLEPAARLLDDGGNGHTEEDVSIQGREMTS